MAEVQEIEADFFVLMVKMKDTDYLTVKNYICNCR